MAFILILIAIGATLFLKAADMTDSCEAVDGVEYCASDFHD